MANDKILSREEFRELQKQSAKEMAADTKLTEDSRELLFRADQHRWIHQGTWLGEPVLNLPQDMFALQEIIFRTRPEYIIEIGVAWGGSLLFYSTLLEVLGGGEVIGVDIFIPDDLKERLNSHGTLSERIHLINGSSVEQTTVDKVKAITGGSRKTMVLLDSNHTHEHVYKELQLYAPFVEKGYYLICGDTIVEDIPEQIYRDRPWGPGNNPKTALNAFMKETNRFEVDSELENKLLFSCNPGGYLRCIED
ncbi:MAG: class I SAM-dependent methyltransferase [Flavobacteriales bacterium]|nr:class I SAM-dependent methyltransferase [Gammaproteobacteria bacterium]MBL4667920.1 class I SAM-dependent methyltransferase [Flavobacteriales bacterium]